MAEGGFDNIEMEERNNYDDYDNSTLDGMEFDIATQLNILENSDKRGKLKKGIKCI